MEIMMKCLAVATVVFLSFFLTEAQNISPPPHGSRGLQPSILIIIGVLGLLVLTMLSIFVYTKYSYRNRPSILSPRHDLHQFLGSMSKVSGLERSVIESIPFFTFSSLKGSKEGLECSVCLSMFEESDVLRLLPKCKHAFHMNCIDKWLESHSSCPLCRYKIDPSDLTNFTCTTSLRYDGNKSPINLMNSPNLELFVEREEDRHGSTRFNIGNSLRKPNKLMHEDCLAIEGGIRSKFHKFKHKIIVADIFHKRRWSDLNSSDLMSLNSEMLNDMSSKRFDYNSPKHCLSLNEQLAMIKEDIERKRNLESGKGKINHTRSDSWSDTLSTLSSKEERNVGRSRLLTSTDKRSMSEITILTRCKELLIKNNRTIDTSALGNDSRDERIQRLWLPIARRTLQWFAVRENNFDKSDMTHTSHV